MNTLPDTLRAWRGAQPNERIGEREMITYRQDGLQPFKITVKLSGKVVGYIKREKDGSGYYYVPRGVKVFTSATYPSVQAVKAHIESGQ